MHEGLKVILVEDDPTVRAGGEQALQLAGLTVESFSTAELAQRHIKPQFAGIVITDVRLPGMSGIEFLGVVKSIDQHIPVILVTGHGDINMAVQAMRDGAYDFIEKPYSSEQLVDVAKRALETRGLMLEVQGPKREFLVPFRKEFVVGVDRSARKLTVDLPEGLIDL